MRILATLLAAVLASSSAFAERPSAEEVSSAVTASLAEYAETHKPPTQEEAIAALESEIAALKEAQVLAIRRAPRRMKRERREKYQSQIEEKQQELARVRDEYTPPEIVPELMPLKIDRVGTVGRVDETFTCLQILGPRRMLCSWVVTTAIGGSNPATIAGQPPARGIPLTIIEHRTVFALDGIDTSRLADDSRVDIANNIIISGQMTYQTVSGADRTVFVLETFDPDVPFK